MFWLKQTCMYYTYWIIGLQLVMCHWLIKTEKTCWSCFWLPVMRVHTPSHLCPLGLECEVEDLATSNTPSQKVPCRLLALRRNPSASVSGIVFGATAKPQV